MEPATQAHFSAQAQRFASHRHGDYRGRTYYDWILPLKTPQADAIERIDTQAHAFSLHTHSGSSFKKASKRP